MAEDGRGKPPRCSTRRRRRRRAERDVGGWRPLFDQGRLIAAKPERDVAIKILPGAGRPSEFVAHRPIATHPARDQ